MALHVRGVLLPDDEVRDLWLVGDRVTFQRVPGARTVTELRLAKRAAVGQDGDEQGVAHKRLDRVPVE